MRRITYNSSTTHHSVNINLPPCTCTHQRYQPQISAVFWLFGSSSKLCTASTVYFKQFWLAWFEENEFGFDIEVAKKIIIKKVVFVGDESDLSLSKSSSSNSSFDFPDSNDAELLILFKLSLRKGMLQRGRQQISKHSPGKCTSAQQTFSSQNISKMFL